jgi:hypothetical protein
MPATNYRACLFKENEVQGGSDHSLGHRGFELRPLPFSAPRPPGRSSKNVFFSTKLLKTVLFFRRLSCKIVFVKLKNAAYLQNTVFVGALHGMLNAEGLAHIFNDLFGGVVYAGIDTDKVNSCLANFPYVSCVRTCMILAVP